MASIATQVGIYMNSILKFCGQTQFSLAYSSGSEWAVHSKQSWVIVILNLAVELLTVQLSQGGRVRGGYRAGRVWACVVWDQARG